MIYSYKSLNSTAETWGIRSLFIVSTSGSSGISAILRFFRIDQNSNELLENYFFHEKYRQKLVTHLTFFYQHGTSLHASSLHRLVVRTSGFHPGNGGSIPPGDDKK